jgi:hypothetical protein
VNGADLKEIGGSLFQGWYNRESVGETTIVATELSEEELDALLTACCAYSSIIISRRNFETLLPIAWKYKITAVLRAIEQYLLNSKGIHVISKLEFAYKCKFAMLASNVVRSLGNLQKRKEVLLSYLTGRKMTECPNYLLEMLELKSLE